MDITEYDVLFVEAGVVHAILRDIALLNIPVETIEQWSQYDRNVVCNWVGAMLWEDTPPRTPDVIKPFM